MKGGYDSEKPCLRPFGALNNWISIRGLILVDLTDIEMQAPVGPQLIESKDSSSEYSE